jgi:hypothetical protein
VSDGFFCAMNAFRRQDCGLAFLYRLRMTVRLHISDLVPAPS